MPVFSTLLPIFVILGLGFVLYWKRIKAYHHFPTFSMASYLIYGFFSGRMKVPIMGYFFQKLVELSKKYESDGIFLIWGFDPLLVIFSEEAVKTFSNEKAAVDKLSSKYDVLKDAFGEGTITSNGEKWRKKRKLFNPVFYKDMLKGKVSTCNEHADHMIGDLQKVTNMPVHLLDYVKKCSFGIICETILGINIHEEKNRVLGLTYLETVIKLAECTTYRMVHPWMRYHIFMHSTAYARECLKWYKTLNHLVSQLLSEMKESAASLIQDPMSENQVGKSFAHILVEHHLKDPNFTMKAMQDEICTYVSAGYDTVSYSMIWSLFLLGHHPHIQNRVFEEVQSKAGEFITYDDTFSLKYLECVIKESLRLYPSVPLYARHLKEDVQCGKFKVPKGTGIIFFPYRLHRNSEIYPDPEGFNPDRYLSGNLEKHPWAYVPFSEGIRSCIGKKFAMMEMKIILAYIIRNYEVKSLDDRDSIELNWEITLMPTKPLYMQLTPRI